MAITGSRVTVAATATLIQAAGSGKSITIKNTDGSASVHLGGSAVTAADGFTLVAGATLQLDLTQNDALYGITSSGTVAVHVLATRT